MALPVISRIFLLFLALVLIIPVSADLPNETLIPPQTGSPVTSVPYTITLFIPTSTMVHSTQMMDLVNVPNSSGDVLLATSFGLSTYNGTWSTRHMTHDNISEGLIDDYIIAVEYDKGGNLWIGYSKGIQIYNGRYYQTIQDQQLLKSNEINDLQRWNDDMWVATGHAGIHRYRDGTWTWFQPESPGGPGFYEVDSMAWDHTANATLITTENEGLWIIRSQEEPIHFDCIAARESTYGLLEHVRRDPIRGVYFFNQSTIVHFSPEVNFTPVLSGRNLSITNPAINDLAAGPDGTLYLATDRGIYIWKNGGIYRHLDRFEGIGTSSIVNTINIDARYRVWFSTQDDLGYYIDLAGQQNPLTIETATPTLPPTPAGNHSARPIPTLRKDTVMTTATDSSAPDSGGINAIIDPLIRAIRALLSGFGLKI